MLKSLYAEHGHGVMKNVGAIVLGGGRGTRLYPLTKMRAKPAVPLCGRYRLIDIPLSNCIHSDINRIAILTQFNSHSLNRHITNTYRFDDFSNGHVTILAAEQTETSGDWFQGTADAVRQHLNHILAHGIKHFIILSGDQLYRMDYRDLLATHLRKGADITVAALPVNKRDAKGFGIMKVRKNGSIREFVEKPTDETVLADLVTPDKVFNDFGLEAKGRPYLASMGIYAFRAEALRELLLGNTEWIDFGKEIIPGALKSHRVQAHMFTGFWEDIGTVRSYFEMSMAMTSSKPPFLFHDPVQPIYTHARMLPGSRIDDAHVKRSIICPGCTFEKAAITDSIIGIRSVVRSGAEITKSVLLGADYYEKELGRRHKIGIGIGSNAKIHHAIIDHNARIGKGAVIRGSRKLKDYEGDGYSIRDGIVVVHKDAVIPSGTVIG